MHQRVICGTTQLSTCAHSFLGGYDDEDEDDTGVDYPGERHVNNMSSNTWDSLPHPIIIDSGAAASVIPTSWCAHVQTRETEESRRGQHYTAANGGKIFNEGERLVTMMSREGLMRDMRFTAC